MTSRLWLVGLLILLGAGWGLTLPLAKIAVSGGYRHFGLIFWQFVIGVILLSGISVWRGKGLKWGPQQVWLYSLIALIGTIIPNSASYEAARHLPAGIISIMISMMPIIAFPIALALRIDQFKWLRLSGLMFGLAGVWLLVGPEASPPRR